MNFVYLLCEGDACGFEVSRITCDLDDHFVLYSNEIEYDSGTLSGVLLCVNLVASKEAASDPNGF